jgi:predicted metal-binding membrane protein
VSTSAALIAVAAFAWLDVIRSASAMNDMAGMGMLMAPTRAGFAAFVAGWTVMMAAMMLPSAVPMIGLHATTRRNAGSPFGRVAAVASFALVYVAVWAGTGIPIYFVDLGLMAVTARGLAYVTAVVLVGAGVFQLSPLKEVCLRKCRSPLGFLLGHWRPGWRGSLRMGLAHAAYCLGCCWALMVVLVAAGAMGLVWVLLVSAVVAAEKLVPQGARIARAAGVILIVAGLAVAAWPALAMIVRGRWPIG